MEEEEKNWPSGLRSAEGSHKATLILLFTDHGLNFSAVMIIASVPCLYGG